MRPEKIAFLLALILFAFITPKAPADEVYSKNKKGNELYKQGNHEEALKLYDDALLLAPGDTALKMNKGSALYRLDRLDEAEAEYNAALAQKNKKRLADAHYNLGNIQFKQGDQLSRSGGQGAMDKYKSALQHYISALDLSPHYKDAKWNLELAQRRIKMQEQQQQQQNQQQDKNKDNKDQQKQDQQNKDNKDQQDKQDQDKKQQEQDKEKQDKNKDQQDPKNQEKQDQEKNQQQQPKPQPQPSKEEMKKQEAQRIIMQFADDADTLNKPPKKKGAALKLKQPEKDW